MSFPVSCSGEVCMLTSHQATPWIPCTHQHKQTAALRYKQKLILNGQRKGEVHTFCFGGQKCSDYMTLQLCSDRSWTWSFPQKQASSSSHTALTVIAHMKQTTGQQVCRVFAESELRVSKTNCLLASLKQVSSLCSVSAAKNTSKKSKSPY